LEKDRLGCAAILVDFKPTTKALASYHAMGRAHHGPFAAVKKWVNKGSTTRDLTFVT
jgi:hypothetical protein